jgi:hypothetical protein
MIFEQQIEIICSLFCGDKNMVFACNPDTLDPEIR